MSIAEIKNLCKVYPAFTLNEISFALESGRITGFIGRNGAGKTTTIKSMLGLVHPSAGEVCYFGMPLAGNENEIKRRIGYSTGAVNYYFLLTGAVTLVRMTVFVDAAVYRTNVLMNANLCYLGFVLLIFGCFNAIFVGGFFKTAYKFGKPFVVFIITAFFIVGVGETLFHIPGLEALGAFGFDHPGIQLGVLGAGIVVFAALTLLSMKKAVRDFEVIDL